MENNYNRVTFDFSNLTSEKYKYLNEDVKLAILRYYWNQKMNGTKEDVKTKVLSIIKRK